LNALDELSSLLVGGSRVIVVAEKDVDLKSLEGVNTLFLLKLAEGSLTSGGRGGGFGERRVVKVLEFRYKDGFCEKLFETEDGSKLEIFEIPYYIARLPLTLVDGADSMGYGVVDPDLVATYAQKAKE